MHSRCLGQRSDLRDRKRRTHRLRSIRMNNRRARQHARPQFRRRQAAPTALKIAQHHHSLRRPRRVAEKTLHVCVRKMMDKQRADDNVIIRRQSPSQHITLKESHTFASSRRARCLANATARSLRSHPSTSTSMASRCARRHNRMVTSPPPHATSSTRNRSPRRSSASARIGCHTRAAALLHQLIRASPRRARTCSAGSSAGSSINSRSTRRCCMASSTPCPSPPCILTIGQLCLPCGSFRLAAAPRETRRSFR